MSVLKPRNRLINFRLTEEEFEKLRDACSGQEARSVSDFARSAVMAQTEHATSGVGTQRLEDMIRALDAHLSQLLPLMQAAEARWAAGATGDAKA